MPKSAIYVDPIELKKVCDQAISNKNAARKLGLNVDTMLRNCDKYGVTRPNIRLGQGRAWTNNRKEKREFPFTKITRLTPEEYQQRITQEQSSQHEVDRQAKAQGQPIRQNII